MKRLDIQMIIMMVVVSIIAAYGVTSISITFMKELVAEIGWLSVSGIVFGFAGIFAGVLWLNKIITKVK